MFSYTFTAAGAYKVQDKVALKTSTIQVPTLATPPAGTLTTTFTITWATQSAPSGYLYDVQIKRPTSNQFVSWLTGQTVANSTFTPDAGTGTYSFRARLRKISNLKASGYSAGASIHVS